MPCLTQYLFRIYSKSHSKATARVTPCLTQPFLGMTSCRRPASLLTCRVLTSHSIYLLDTNQTPPTEKGQVIDYTLKNIRPPAELISNIVTGTLSKCLLQAACWLSSLPQPPGRRMTPVISQKFASRRSQKDRQSIPRG
jgi:hypothetical protein